MAPHSPVNQHSSGEILGGSWPPLPPEVPRPEPMRPSEPPHTAPAPILPSWEERTFEEDIAERLLEQRVVIVGGRLDHRLSNHVAAQLLLLGRRSGRPIDLHLACPEAELEPALALADAVELVRAPVHAIVRGPRRGPAVAVLCAAASRGAHRHATLVLSLPPWGPAEGTADELATLAEQRERQVDRIRDRICAVTGRSEVEVAADLSTGRVMSAEEAREYGLLTTLL